MVIQRAREFEAKQPAGGFFHSAERQRCSTSSALASFYTGHHRDIINIARMPLRPTSRPRRLAETQSVQVAAAAPPRGSCHPCGAISARIHCPAPCPFADFDTTLRHDASRVCCCREGWRCTAEQPRRAAPAAARRRTGCCRRRPWPADRLGVAPTPFWFILSDPVRLRFWVR